MTSWKAKVVKSEDGSIKAHTMPINDLLDHAFETTCWCNPKARPYRGQIIWMHSALNDQDDDVSGEKVN